MIPSFPLFINLINDGETSERNGFKCIAAENDKYTSQYAKIINISRNLKY